MIRSLLFIFFFSCFGLNLKAQRLEQTPVKSISLQETAEKNMSSVKKATLLSIIPGGGQIYNKSYWKVPVIYAGFGALGYSYVFYNRVYNDVRQAYIQKLNNEPITNPEYENVSEDMLYNLRESYRKSRDLSVIGMAGWYAFNLMDAAVDAHLKGFDVGEKLTLKVKPQYQYGPSYSYAGLSLKLNF